MVQVCVIQWCPHLGSTSMVAVVRMCLIASVAYMNRSAHFLRSRIRGWSFAQGCFMPFVHRDCNTRSRPREQRRLRPFVDKHLEGNEEGGLKGTCPVQVSSIHSRRARSLNKPCSHNMEAFAYMTSQSQDLT